jgi:nitrogen regulatory protein PII
MNKALHLGISEKMIQDIKNIEEFSRLSQAEAFRKDRDSEQHFHHAYLKSGQDLEVITEMEHIPEVLEAVRELAKQGTILYTIRTVREPENVETTRAWLSKHGFPSPENVFLPGYYNEEFSHARATAEPGEPIIFISDISRGLRVPSDSSTGSSRTELHV